MYVHCIEWNESPQDGISKVQQKSFDNGLTAFDPESQLEASRENAVRASITVSLELLTEDETIILFYIASLIIGFGVYTFKDVLHTALDMDLKQFDKCTKNLWCHGLLGFQDVIFPNAIIKIPCIGIHEVIAHYINEHMPDEFYLHFKDRTLEIFLGMYKDQYFGSDSGSNVGQIFLDQVYATKIPFCIRFLMFLAKSEQIHFYHIVNEFFEQNTYLFQNKSLHNIQLQFPSVKHIHTCTTIKQDCKLIQLLLADGKHDEAVTWAKQYFSNHPCKLSVEKIIIYLNTLLVNESCKICCDHKVISTIEESISHFNKHLVNCQAIQRNTIHQIIGYNHVLCLINAAASDDDLDHYLLCSMLYTSSI